VGHDAWGMGRSTSPPFETSGWTASDETEVQAHSVGSVECNEAPTNPRGNRARLRAVRATRPPPMPGRNPSLRPRRSPSAPRYPVQYSAAEGLCPNPPPGRRSAKGGGGRAPNTGFHIERRARRRRACSCHRSMDSLSSHSCRQTPHGCELQLLDRKSADFGATDTEDRTPAARSDPDSVTRHQPYEH